MHSPTAGGAETTSAPLLDVDGARATIRLNRPKHLNRLQPEDLDTLLHLFDRVEADPAIRVMVQADSNNDHYAATSAKGVCAENAQIRGWNRKMIRRRVVPLERGQAR